MTPTEILKSEHRVIEQVLDCLDQIIAQAESAGQLDGQSAGQAIDFFRTFADGCHHSKEENHLFPALEAKGFPRHGGPTGVMLHEHDLGRKAIAGMAAELDRAASGDRHAIARFAHHGRSYTDLLREHIQKEDHILFAMADRTLSDDEQRELAAGFDRIEDSHRAAGTHQRYLGIANELADRFGVSCCQDDIGAPTCGCSH